MNRTFLIATMLVILFPWSLAAEQREVNLTLVDGPKSHTFPPKTEELLINKIEELIRSSNFDSVNHPSFPSLIVVDGDWADACSSGCLEVLYAKPKSFKTIGGPLSLSAFRISKWKVIGRNGERIVRLGKWNGGLHIQILEDSKLASSSMTQSNNNRSDGTSNP